MMLCFKLSSALLLLLLEPRHLTALVVPHARTTTVAPRYGFMDMIKSAFSNEVFDDRRAKASHILVRTEDSAKEIQALLDSGEKTFEEAAREFSTCPSASKGGSLGSFEPGKMVPQFDAVCFDESIPIGDVTLVKTVFGYHLVKVEDRFLNTVKSEGSSVF